MHEIEVYYQYLALLFDRDWMLESFFSKKFNLESNTYDHDSLIIVLNLDNQQFEFENFLIDVVQSIEYDHKVYPN